MGLLLIIYYASPPYLDPVVHIWIASIARIKMNSLQYTRIVNGLFMDYWGMPHVPTSLIPHTFGINIGKREAVIPGDGNNIICMTLLRDMTNYLVKLLDIEEWPEFSVFVGDELSYNQMVKIAEEVTGMYYWYEFSGKLEGSLSFRFIRHEIQSDLRQR